MSARPPRRHAYAGPRWFRVRHPHVRCAYGCAIEIGQLATFHGRKNGLRFIICQPCNKTRYNREPSEQDIPQWTGVDGRSLQLPPGDR